MRFSPDGTFQEVVESAYIEFPLIDIMALDSASQDAKLADVLDSEASTPFDLLNGPLVRTKLLRMTANHHVFVFSSHHIVYDGWSTSVLLEDLSEVYSALCEGRAYKLSDVTQFSDYAAELQEEEGSEEVQEAEQYWLDQFASLPPVLDLPTDHARPAIKSYDGRSVKVSIKPSVYRAIKQTAADQNSTLFTTLFSAYNVFLSRLSGQKDIVVGIFSAGQAMSGHFNMIGHCVNFLPLRTRLHANLRFNELLSETKVTVLDGYDHYQVAFGRILQMLKIERDMSRLPLVEAIFNLDKDGEAPGFSHLNSKIAQAPKRAANFDLFFNINEIEGELVVDCDYSSKLFDESTIRRWIAHFETLLAGIAANPYARISDLPLLTSEQRHQMLVEWNNTQQVYPEQTVCELFEAQVERTPNAVAVTFPSMAGAEQLTYQALNQQANQLAHHLQALGVGPETLVGLAVERGTEMLVGMLAILKAGGAYVPIDPAYPVGRIAHMLSDSQAKVLLIQQKLSQALPAHQAQVVYIDSMAQEWQNLPDTPPQVGATPDNLAYIIYTSGSTGKPKGVQVPHRGLTNFLSSMAQAPGLTQDDILLAVTTLSFDIAGLELFLPLTVGAQVVIASREVATDGFRLQALLSSSSATVMQATPATWRLLLAAGWQNEEQIKILCGGEALPQALAEQLLSQGSELWNMYGPTETTIWSTTHPVKKTEPLISIGRPIANTQVYILDEAKEPAPIGVIGDLYIGGDGLTRGYLNRPQLTAERFIANPFDAADLLYKTGDLARYLPGESIQFLGRIDHQVKIRGYRIELGEIESALGDHPAVRETVVVARDDKAEKELVAYIVPDSQIEAQESDLIATLRAHLLKMVPDYMVPSAFVMLDTLPLTPNGKVNRLALPAPEMSESNAKSFNPPENAMQKQVADIWAEVLRLSRVDIHANFFQLGGHSLLATQVISRLRDTFQVELLLRNLFEAPTVAGLANRIETMQWASQAVVTSDAVEHDGNNEEEENREFFEI